MSSEIFGPDAASRSVQRALAKRGIPATVLRNFTRAREFQVCLELPDGAKLFRRLANMTNHAVRDRVTELYLTYLNQ